MYEDGGPVIGIQIENEYGHVGGQTEKPVSSICGPYRRWQKRLAFACHCIQRPAGAVR